MRIDQLTVRNFKSFAEATFDLDPHFTLLVGENGSGKTSVLDALAVSLGVWLVDAPDSALHNSRRNILPTEIRLAPARKGDRVQFHECLPVVVHARGCIHRQQTLAWTRQIREGGSRTTNADARDALRVIKDIYRRDHEGEQVLCPVLAHYGAGRGWLASNERIRKPTPNGPARRWAAFYDCFNERIRFADLQRWFSRETTAAGSRGGRMRPGYEVVRRAVLGCVPDADDVWFDADSDQIVLSISGNAQPFSNLSAGQRMMLALVADIATRAVTQNAHLLSEDALGEDDPLPRLLHETPGVVLIDELDVHLHPRWQRRVATDLKRTFPAIQFVCTSHSPQVIGELARNEIRLLGEGVIGPPRKSYGIDSSRILEEIMGAEPRNAEVSASLSKLFLLIDREDFVGARGVLAQVERALGADDPEITRARALMTFLEDTE